MYGFPPYCAVAMSYPFSVSMIAVLLRLSNPSAPSVPSAPSAPSVPSVPSTPSAPGGPAGPTVPGGPRYSHIVVYLRLNSVTSEADIINNVNIKL